MVLCSVRLDQFSCKLPADPTKRFPEYFDSFSVHHFFPVSDHKGQMDVQIENARASIPFDTRKVSSWMGLGFSCPREDGFGLSTAGRSREHQEMSPCPGGGIIGRSRFRPSGRLSNQDKK
jgi:hypothetical protein